MSQTEPESKTQCRTLAEALDNFHEQLIERMAKNRGHWEIFQNSKSVDGFETVKKAWLSTFREFHHRHTFKNFQSVEEPLTTETLPEWFFWKLRLNASEALKECATLISTAAKNGDTKFFQRICSELRKPKRNQPMDMLGGEILIHWIGCCLWSASDHAASIYLQQVTKKTVLETSYARARERLEKLGLVGYKVAHKKPLITGCTKAGSFIFQTGWTNLVPSSSR